MQSIIEAIQGFARQRTRGDISPLVLLRPLDGNTGERITHLPVETELAHAWLAQSGEPFRPHQAQAIMALRRGEPVALCSDNPAVAQTAALLIHATLQGDSSGVTLVVAADAQTARAAARLMERITPNLPHGLRLPHSLVAPGQRPDPRARVVITSPDLLHERLLRHHDRAWSLFWSRLRMVVLAEPQRAGAIGGAHLADLLLRARRVALSHGAPPPALLVTLPNLADPQPALALLHSQPWRVIRADDMPFEPTTLAVWHGADRLRESADMAVHLHRLGYRVHVGCQPLEQAVLAPIIGELKGLTRGPEHVPAQALILAGYPGAPALLQRALRAGYQAVVVVLGEQPHEQMLERHAQSLLTLPPPAWLPPPFNVYAAAQHVLAAAAELPLAEEEVEGWGVGEIVDRLVGHGQLVDLPGADPAWKPTGAAGDPYADFSVLSASGPAVAATGEQGQPIESLDPAGFERWAFAGAALPPGAGGLRVLRRNEDEAALVLRLESNGRRTYPLRRCTVTLRDTHESRELFGARPISWGRVLVEEEMYGYRELSGAGPAAEVGLKPPLSARWSAPACWFDLVADMQVSGQFVGWSLAAALPLRVFAAMSDVVPCYDQARRRLYLVDAQPGGSGLAAWIYEHAEELLPLAYDVALACRNDPLLEPLSRLDRDWLLALLGRGESAGERAITLPPARAKVEVPRPSPADTQTIRPAASPAPERAPLRTPEPGRPRIEFTPAPEPVRQPEPPRRQEQPRAELTPPERRVEPPAPWPSDDRLMRDLLSEPPPRSQPPQLPPVRRDEPAHRGQGLMSGRASSARPEPRQDRSERQPSPSELSPAEPRQRIPDSKPPLRREEPARRVVEPTPNAVPEPPRREETSSWFVEPAPQAAPEPPRQEQRLRSTPATPERQRAPEPEPAPPRRQEQTLWDAEGDEVASEPPRQEQPPRWTAAEPEHAEPPRRAVELEQRAPEPAPPRRQEQTFWDAEDEEVAPEPPRQERQLRSTPAAPEPTPLRRQEQTLWDAEAEEVAPEPPRRTSERQRAPERADPPRRAAEPERPQEPSRQERQERWTPAQPEPTESPRRTVEPERPQEPPRRSGQNGSPPQRNGRDASPRRSGREVPRQSQPEPPRNGRAAPPEPPAERRPQPEQQRRADTRQPPAEPPRRNGQPAESPRRAEPPRPSAPPPAPAEEGPPDPRAMIERLRRQRQQREAEVVGDRREAAPGRTRPAADTPVEPRFAAGDQVFCLPYGEGVVRSSQIDEGRELVQIAFSSYGELTIDPSVSLVRKVSSQQYDDDLL
ncbi:MAG TPA: hypothetical protein VFS21_32610 [Roseiflexaceae bacterium]|nr:hypothetical protein [Roseiflexaceae bacterium]